MERQLRGAVIIQSADENSSILPPRHLPLANQHSSLEEERADLIGVATSWGVGVVRARLLHISSMHGGMLWAQRPVKFPFPETYQRFHEQTKLCLLREEAMYF